MADDAPPGGNHRGKSGRSALLAKARAGGGGGGSQNDHKTAQSHHNTAQTDPAPSDAVNQTPMTASAGGAKVLGKDEGVEERAAAFGFVTDPVLKNANPIAAQLLKYPLSPTALLPEYAFAQKCGRGCRCSVSLAGGSAPVGSSPIPSLDKYAAAPAYKKRKGSQGNGSGIWGSAARNTSPHLTSPAAVEEVQRLKSARLLGPDHEEPSHFGSKVPYVPPSFPDSRSQVVPTLASLLPSYSRFFVTLTPNCLHLPNVAAAAEHTLRTTVAQEALAAGRAALKGGAQGSHSGLGIPGLGPGLQQQQHQHQHQQQQQQGVGNSGLPLWAGGQMGIPQSAPSFVYPSWFDRESGSFVKPPWESQAPSGLAALAQLHMTQWQKH